MLLPIAVILSRKLSLIHILIIGDNVQMERALLIVKNNLRIGTNCRIKGIVAAGGEITIGVNFSLQRREDVLEPYFAAMYLE